MRKRTKIIILVIESMLLFYIVSFVVDLAIDHKFIIESSKERETMLYLLSKAEIVLAVTFVVQFLIILWLVLTTPTKS